MRQIKNLERLSDSILIGNRSSFFGRRAEDAGENPVYFLQMVLEVEKLFELADAEKPRHFWIPLQQVDQLAFALPGAHGVFLDQAIGVLARHAFLGEGEKHATAVDDAAGAV